MPKKRNMADLLDKKKLILASSSPRRAEILTRGKVKFEIKIPLNYKEENIFSDPDLVIGPVNVPKGELDQNGLVTGTESSEDTISLNYEELQIFRNSPFWVAGKLDLPGTDGNIIKALATDFIQIISYVEVEVKNKKD